MLRIVRALMTPVKTRLLRTPAAVPPVELINTVPAATVRLVVVVYHVTGWRYDWIVVPPLN